MMSAPVNSYLEEPTYPAQDYCGAREDWKRQAEDWLRLNEFLGNPNFFPLTTKAFYVLGVIYQICQSVSLLLASEKRESTYIPAYGIFASGIELLGRCITGNSSAHKASNDLKAGFWWLAKASYQNVDGNYEIIETSTRKYTIADLVALRHFAAHGQATMSKPVKFDDELFSRIANPDKHLIADGLEHYWARVQDNEEICNRLAKANVIPFRDPPLLKTLELFSSNRAVGDIFKQEFDWCMEV